MHVLINIDASGVVEDTHGDVDHTEAVREVLQDIVDQLDSGTEIASLHGTTVDVSGNGCRAMIIVSTGGGR
jgi:type 1 glutamine amidotransferase